MEVSSERLSRCLPLFSLDNLATPVSYTHLMIFLRIRKILFHKKTFYELFFLFHLPLRQKSGHSLLRSVKMCIRDSTHTHTGLLF